MSSIRHKIMLEHLSAHCDNFHIVWIGDPMQLPEFGKLNRKIGGDWFYDSKADETLIENHRQDAVIVPTVLNFMPAVDPDVVYITITNKMRHKINCEAHIKKYGKSAFIDQERGILTPVVGQSLICRHTDKNQTYLNNKTYVIEKIIKRERNSIKVKFEGKRTSVNLEKDWLTIGRNVEKDSRFEMAYAHTGHSAQGKEYDNICVVLERTLVGKDSTKQYSMPAIEEYVDRWLYMALNRAKKSAMIIDTTGAIGDFNLNTTMSAPVRKIENLQTIPVFNTAPTKFSEPADNVVLLHDTESMPAPVVINEKAQTVEIIDAVDSEPASQIETALVADAATRVKIQFHWEGWRNLYHYSEVSAFLIRSGTRFEGNMDDLVKQIAIHEGWKWDDRRIYPVKPEPLPVPERYLRPFVAAA